MLRKEWTLSQGGFVTQLMNCQIVPSRVCAGCEGRVKARRQHSSIIRPRVLPSVDRQRRSITSRAQIRQPPFPSQTPRQTKMTVDHAPLHIRTPLLYSSLLSNKLGA